MTNLLKRMFNTFSTKALSIKTVKFMQDAQTTYDEILFPRMQFSEVPGLQ